MGCDAACDVRGGDELPFAPGRRSFKPSLLATYTFDLVFMSGATWQLLWLCQRPLAIPSLLWRISAPPHSELPRSRHRRHRSLNFTGKLRHPIQVVVQGTFKRTVARSSEGGGGVFGHECRLLIQRWWRPLGQQLLHHLPEVLCVGALERTKCNEWTLVAKAFDLGQWAGRCVSLIADDDYWQWPELRWHEQLQSLHVVGGICRQGALERCLQIQSDLC